MKHKQRREPMEFPLLEIIAFPADEHAVSIIVPAEFELTGEIMISLGSRTQELSEVKLLLEHVVNRIADLMWEEARKEEPPFIVTGKSTREDAPTE